MFRLLRSRCWRLSLSSSQLLCLWILAFCCCLKFLLLKKVYRSTSAIICWTDFFSLKIPPRKDGILALESEDTCLCQPIDWSMAAMLRDSVVIVVVVVVVRTRPRAIPLAMIAIRKILHGFPFLSRDAYGAPLGGPSGRRSSAISGIVSPPLPSRPLPTSPYPWPAVLSLTFTLTSSA